MLSLVQSVRTRVAPAAVRAMSSGHPLDASKLITRPTTEPKSRPPPDLLGFGQYFTDHMVEVDWTEGTGWGTPVLSEYHPLTLDPACSVFHYALECFEGMKAYMDADGNARLFRPMLNMNRMHTSMQRLALPSFDKEEFLECIKALVLMDKDWIPRGDGTSLYLRPTGIGTHPFLGVAPSKSAKLFVICSPVGSYYPGSVSLYADKKNSRAWPGGTGGFKIGGNYAPTIQPVIEAGKKGFGQILWLTGDDELSEVGTMNLFVVWKSRDGELELVTAPLSDGTILPGVTRQSILDLGREWGEFKVSERVVKMAEVAEAHDEGRLVECFGAGTAVVVSSVDSINWNDKTYNVPLDPTDPHHPRGPLAQRFYDAITDIQYGRAGDHPWSVVLN